MRQFIWSLVLLGMLHAPQAALADPTEYDLELKATFHTSDDHIGAGRIIVADGNGNGWLEIYQYAYIEGYGWPLTIEEVSPDFQVTELFRLPNTLPWEVGDADSDGLTDMIVSDYYSTFDLLEAPAPGMLPTIPVFSAGWYGTYESYAVTMDLDQDGFKEVVTNGNDFDDTMHIFECDGDNSFSYVGTLQLTGTSVGHVSGDFDSDGQMELVIGDGRGYVTVFEQHGGVLPEPTWQERVNPEGSYCAGALTIDLEMDGTNEVAFMCLDQSIDQRVVRLLKGTGNDEYIVEDVGSIGAYASRPALYFGYPTGHLWPAILQYRRVSGVRDLVLWSYSTESEYVQSGLLTIPGDYALALASGWPTADFDFDGRDEIVWATEIDYDLPGAIFSVDYSDDFEPPVTGGFDPPIGSHVTSGTAFELSGSAEDDYSGIRSVEASTDLGVTWEIVSIFPDWSMELEVPMEGELEVALRATDCSFKVEDPPAVWWGYAVTPTPAPTPLPLAVSLALPKTYFSPGDTFRLDAELTNPDLGFQAPLAVLLDVYGAYWFWPSWCEYPPDWDYQLVTVHQGLQTLPIIDPFPWPDTGAETLTGIWFHAALLDETMTAILGEADSVEWGYGP